jgi:hypothetical protein
MTIQEQVIQKTVTVHRRADMDLDQNKDDQDNRDLHLVLDAQDNYTPDFEMEDLKACEKDDED